MNGFLKLLDALKAGQSLTNSATWKVRQNAVAALVSVLGGLLVVSRWAGFSVEVSADDLAAIAGGVAAVYGVFNTVVTTATTDKIGLQAGGDSDPEARKPS